MTLTREEIAAVYAGGVDAVARVIAQLEARITTLEEHLGVQAAQIQVQEQALATMSARVKELEDHARTTSRTSSKPPSSDGFVRPPRSLRRQSGQKPGGQPGHVGRALHMVDEPDRVIVHSPAVCAGCQRSLADVPAQRYERRQVLDVPPVRLEASEHRAEAKICPVCAHTTHGTFPAPITRPVQYGERLKALAVYLVSYQLLPYDRASELLIDLFGQGPTDGAVYAAVSTCAEALEEVEVQIKDTLGHADVLHNDETGVRVQGTLQWLHVASTARLTHYAVHPKRGSEAITAIGVLPTFAGTSVHDGWSAYAQYSCRHALCNAHHLRELTAIVEHDQQPWAARMKDLLLDIKTQVAEQRARGATGFTDTARADFAQRYQEILDDGFAANPPPPAPEGGPKRRGRPKQSKAKNLLDRLSTQRQAVLAFMDDWRVPFDNNQAERDLRMVKVQQKVSGCFRSPAGAAAFCRIRGYVSTLRKQGLQILPALHSVFAGQPLIPTLAAQ
jgi:transposase